MVNAHELNGKVALVTGAARGMGRSHAVRLAEEGADIIGVDLCAQIDTVPYPMSVPEDLAETVRLVESQDRRMASYQADVRDFGALKSAVEAGVGELGRLDIIVANAGIAVPEVDGWVWNLALDRWRDVIDVNLTGVWHTLRAAVPAIIEGGRGGSVILISSTGGLKGMSTQADYTSSKHAVVGLSRTLAKEVAVHRIRVNTVHPTGVRTPMIENDYSQKYYETLGAEATAAHLQNLLPVEMIDPIDISNAIVWLASDQARYVTGVSLPIDAGLSQR
jgi:SDR family mycofactocin-dependent oxidoreductase